MGERNTSIRRKITVGFVIRFLFISIIAGAVSFNLLRIEERVKFNAITSKFLDTVLEIRRFEKNYFLYKNRQDYQAAISYIHIAEELILDHREQFDGTLKSAAGWPAAAVEENQRLSAPERLSEGILALLEEYRALFEKDFQLKTHPPKLEQELRKHGRELTDFAERLAQQEREQIQTMLSGTRRNLLIWTALFVVGAAVITILTFQIVIQPLNELESNMKKISSGNFEMLSLKSEDNEIKSINQAFNRMIRELFKQRQEIIRSEKLASLGTMLAGIAHEINNPLSNISTSSEILFEELEGSDTDLKKELSRQIISETDRAKDIIRTLLEFSREKDGEQRLVSLLTAVRDALTLVRGDLPAAVSVHTNVPAEITILADKQKIQRAFINLLKNAVDAIRDKGKAGSIQVAARKIGADEVEMTISDTGAGIPEGLLNKVFDPFFTTKDIGHGTGLGLYLTHRIIDQHHGTIKVESRPDEGTTFIIRLPAGNLHTKRTEDGR
jgi:signal transduction histidine kinase